MQALLSHEVAWPPWLWEIYCARIRCNACTVLYIRYIAGKIVNIEREIEEKAGERERKTVRKIRSIYIILAY
jgi:hypothetical protein